MVPIDNFLLAGAFAASLNNSTEYLPSLSNAMPLTDSALADEEDRKCLLRKAKDWTKLAIKKELEIRAAARAAA